MCPQCLGFVAPVPSLQPEPDEQTPSSKCTGYTSSLADSSFLNLTRTKIEALAAADKRREQRGVLARGQAELQPTIRSLRQVTSVPAAHPFGGEEASGDRRPMNG